MVKIKDHLKQLKSANLPNLKEVAKSLGHEQITKLNYNENNFGPTPSLYKRFKLEDPHIYPEYKSPELGEKLANFYNLKSENFYITNGSDAILDLIPTLFAELGQNLVIPNLTYNRIEMTAKVQNLNVKKVPLIDGKIDLNATQEAIDEQTAIVYIVNPNMPTGVANSFESLVTFLEKIPSHVLVVIDEAYIEFYMGIEDTFMNDKTLLERFANIVITHTFSKLYGLAAFRIGYCLAARKIIDLFERAAQYLPINKYSVQAAMIALDDLPYYKQIIENIRDEKQRFYAKLTKLGCQYYQSDTNFIFILWNNPEAFMHYALVHFKIIVRPIQNFALRIAIGRPLENIAILNALETYLQTNKLEQK